MIVGNVIIGKRISIGAALYGISEAIQAIYPEHAPVIRGLTVPIILLVQIAIVNILGVTTNAGRNTE